LGSSVHLFVYGSLVDVHTLDQVLGRRHAGERFAARLEGYERTRLDTYAYPFIVAAPGRYVDGVLVMDLSPIELEALDEYEDVDTLVYERQAVEVEVWGCGPRTIRLPAQTYLGGPALLAGTAT
jgi:gamma-glutamylcyclotransferase (GGCT)/AIG2-like uncharacterized protein YtfP